MFSSILLPLRHSYPILSRPPSLSTLPFMISQPMFHLIPPSTYVVLHCATVLQNRVNLATLHGFCVRTEWKLLPSRRPVVGHRRHHRVDGSYVVPLPKDHRLDDGSAGVGGTRATGSGCRHAWPHSHGRLPFAKPCHSQRKRSAAQRGKTVCDSI